MPVGGVCHADGEVVSSVAQKQIREECSISYEFCIRRDNVVRLPVSAVVVAVGLRRGGGAARAGEERWRGS